MYGELKKLLSSNRVRGSRRRGRNVSNKFFADLLLKRKRDADIAREIARLEALRQAELVKAQEPKSRKPRGPLKPTKWGN